MKNVTVTISEELHKKARIWAAEQGMSLSGLVKFCLEGIIARDLKDNEGDDLDAGHAPPPAASGHVVKEQAMPFTSQPFTSQPLEGASAAPVDAGKTPQKGPAGQPYCVDGQWVWTPDGKPRQPGVLEGKSTAPDDFDTPDWLIDAFEGIDADKSWPE